MVIQFIKLTVLIKKIKIKGDRMPPMPPMLDELGIVFHILDIVAALSAVGTVILAYKLYAETDKGWYWLSLLLSALFLALSEWIIILFPLVQSFELLGILREISEISSTLLFAISCFGIYTTMKDIRKRVE